MNSRQRFLAVLRGEQIDHPPLFPEGLRDEVVQAWRTQGLPQEAKLEDLFYYDPFEELDPDVYPSPEINDWSTPERLLPLLRERLDPADSQRLPGNWKQQVKKWKSRQHPLFLRIHQGLFLSLGIEEWRSFAPAMLRLVDQPDFVHQILAIQADFAVHLADKILSQVDLDGVIFSEPIAGNHGVLISPQMYRTFALNSYAPLFDLFQDYQIPAIIWRSYANPLRLLPEVLKYPFNVLWLCELPPTAGMSGRLGELSNQKITLMGGIDTDILYHDSQTIHQAVEAVKPFVENGYFIPLADGRVREDVPYQNYASYRQELTRNFITGL